MKDPYEARTKHGAFRGYGWFCVPQWNLTIAAPPKGGSSALKQFMWMNEIPCSYIPHHQVRGPTFFVVRDPLSRFVSLWRSKCRDKAPIWNEQIYGMTPTELMDHIESGEKDVHWTPQVELIGKLNPTCIPLEQLTSWWVDRGYGKLMKFNVTDGEVDIDGDLLERIMGFYAADMTLYATAILHYQQEEKNVYTI